MDDWASVDHALRTTRSVRRKLDLERPVPREVIESCIETAVQAPTGRLQEAWRFVVVTDPVRKRALGELYRSAFDELVAEWSDRFAQQAEEPPRPGAHYRLLAERIDVMPALILVCMEGEPEPAESVAGQVAFYGSVLPAAWSLMVALRARGLGSTWTSLHLRHADRAAHVLGIPEGVTQTVLLPVAYTKGAKLRPAQRLGARDVTFWNAWGERD